MQLDNVHQHRSVSNCSSLPIRLITHNIRYIPKNLDKGEKPWRTRLPLLAAHFRYHAAHCPHTLICVQEALHSQLVDLIALLNSISLQEPAPFGATGRAGWEYLGVGRDDGVDAGEHCAILYRPAAWNLISQQTTWLSPTPTIPGSKGWGAGSPRVVTIAHLQSKHSNTSCDYSSGNHELLLVNTHLDNVSDEARRHSASMIENYLQTWKAQGLPIFLTADLNSNEKGSAYRMLTDGSLIDLRFSRAMHEVYGEYNTFTGFAGNENDLERLDYIFAVSSTSPESESSSKDRDHMDSAPKSTVEGYAVVPNKFSDSSVYHSDHRAVVADLRLYT